jgi:long-chain acyl-CoA synthetase
MTSEASPATDIPGRFRATARRRGSALAILADEGSWTFEALDQATDAVAASLADAGIVCGDRVGLLSVNCAEFVIAYLAILKAGATVVPLNTLLNPREMSFILADSGALALFYHPALAVSALAALNGQDCIRLLVCLGGGAAPGAALLSEFMRNPSRAPALPTDLGGDLAAILYTSGTTGRPKGAMLTHGNLLSNAASVAQALGFNESDRVLVVLPMFHAFAATVGVLTPLLQGFGLVSVIRFEPKLLAQSIERHGATLFLGVPSMYGVLLRLEEELVACWRGIRLCVSGGAAMPVAVMSAFETRFAVPVLEGDGPTECGPVTSVNPVQGERKPGSVGLPVPQVEMQIFDAQGCSVRDGEMGEVCVRGPSVMKGYFNLPESTRESFFGDWFRTGDLGYRDEGGYFFLVDRLKDLIITNGMNVYPRVIEEVLYTHPEIAEVAVVGDPDTRHGEVPVAHVALRPGSIATAAALRAWCREHLGQHEIPRRIHLHDRLPKNATGKILKRELRRSGEQERGVTIAPLRDDAFPND